MRRILLGDRNVEHRSRLKEALGRHDADLVLECAGSGDELLLYLAERSPGEMPEMILLEPTLPFTSELRLESTIRSDPRFASIRIVIWAEQASPAYYTARSSPYTSMAFLKPLRPIGWEILARKLLTLLPPAEVIR